MNWNLHPSEGYVYYDLNGAKLVAANWHELARKLYVLHQRNNDPISLDEAYQRIEQQVCQRDPAFCPSISKVGFTYSRAKDVVRKRVSLFEYQKAIQWLIAEARRRADQPAYTQQYVPEIVAEERAKICFQCVYHKFYNQACNSCRNQLYGLRKQLIGDRLLKEKLGYCGLFYDDLAVKIHLSEAYNIESDIRKLMPPDCWRNDAENR